MEARLIRAIYDALSGPKRVAQLQQNYFNELAEQIMTGEITTEQACSLFKDFSDAIKAKKEADRL